jgi:uncharacterized membrane protein (DUF2068 family)
VKPSLHIRSAREIGLRVAAIFEATKGLLVLVAGSGLLLLVHRDVQDFAEHLIAHTHLNPAGRYPTIFLKVATEATPARLRLLAFGALIYAIVRFVEAVGLWHARRWAEWLGVASGLMYLPFELRAMIRHPGLEPLIALLLNLGVVLFLGLQLESRTAASTSSHSPRSD